MESAGLGVGLASIGQKGQSGINTSRGPANAKPVISIQKNQKDRKVRPLAVGGTTAQEHEE